MILKEFCGLTRNLRDHHIALEDYNTTLQGAPVDLLSAEIGPSKGLEPHRGSPPRADGGLTMAVGIDNEPPARRATFALCRFTPTVRLATPIGGAAIFLFAAPTDALSAIGALVAAVVSPPQ
jgi:hypothetical protein